MIDVLKFAPDVDILKTDSGKTKKFKKQAKAFLKKISAGSPVYFKVS